MIYKLALMTLISSNAIKAHTKLIVMSHYAKVRNNVYEQGVSGSRHGVAIWTETLFYIYIHFILQCLISIYLPHTWGTSSHGAKHYVKLSY